MFSCGQPLGASSKAGEMMTDPTKLAKALGWERHRLKNQDTNYWVAPTGFPTANYCMTTDMLAAYFASPAGEKAVEKRVEELCPKGSHICHVYFPDLPKGHRLGIDLPGSPEYDCYTKSEAYAAMVIWLAEQQWPDYIDRCKEKLAERGD